MADDSEFEDIMAQRREASGEGLEAYGQGPDGEGYTPFTNDETERAMASPGTVPTNLKEALEHGAWSGLFENPVGGEGGGVMGQGEDDSAYVPVTNAATAKAWADYDPQANLCPHCGQPMPAS